MDNDKLIGQVRLMRWHPVAEEWKPAEEALPEDEAAVAAEIRERESQASDDRRHYGEYGWEVLIETPHIRDTHDLAEKLRDEGLPVKRRVPSPPPRAPSPRAPRPAT